MIIILMNNNNLVNSVFLNTKYVILSDELKKVEYIPSLTDVKVMQHL